MTEDLRFDPETIRIDAGATVVWENTTEIKHTVTALEGETPEKAAYFASGGFDSERAAREQQNEGLIAPDGSYEHAFDATGTFEYVCLPHEESGMKGSVEVSRPNESG